MTRRTKTIIATVAATLVAALGVTAPAIGGSATVAEVPGGHNWCC